MRIERTPAWALLVALGLAAAACGVESESEGLDARTMPDATVETATADHESSDRHRATRMELLAIEEKRAFTEALERHINTLEQEIEDAGQQLADIEDSAEDVLAARREDLRTQRVELVAKWREVQEASRDQWRDMQTELVDAWAKTRQEADTFLAELRDAMKGENS